MKLWQKTYLLSTLLCALILYGCMFGVTVPAIRSTVNGATEAALREETPLGRLGTPDDIARSAYFLCSGDADFITGQVLGVNGGLVV